MYWSFLTRFLPLRTDALTNFPLVNSVYSWAVSIPMPVTSLRSAETVCVCLTGGSSINLYSGNV